MSPAEAAADARKSGAQAINQMTRSAVSGQIASVTPNPMLASQPVAPVAPAMSSHGVMMADVTSQSASEDQVKKAKEALRDMRAKRQAMVANGVSQHLKSTLEALDCQIAAEQKIVDETVPKPTRLAQATTRLERAQTALAKAQEAQRRFVLKMDEVLAQWQEERETLETQTAMAESVVTKTQQEIEQLKQEIATEAADAPSDPIALVTAALRAGNHSEAMELIRAAAQVNAMPSPFSPSASLGPQSPMFLYPPVNQRALAEAQLSIASSMPGLGMHQAAELQRSFEAKMEHSAVTQPMHDKLVQSSERTCALESELRAAQEDSARKLAEFEAQQKQLASVAQAAELNAMSEASMTRQMQERMSEELSAERASKMLQEQWANERIHQVHQQTFAHQEEEAATARSKILLAEASMNEAGGMNAGIESKLEQMRSEVEESKATKLFEFAQMQAHVQGLNSTWHAKLQHAEHEMRARVMGFQRQEEAQLLEQCKHQELYQSEIAKMRSQFQNMETQMQAQAAPLRPEQLTPRKTESKADQHYAQFNEAAADSEPPPCQHYSLDVSVPSGPPMEWQLQSLEKWQAEQAQLEAEAAKLSQKAKPPVVPKRAERGAAKTGQTEVEASGAAQARSSSSQQRPQQSPQLLEDTPRRTGVERRIQQKTPADEVQRRLKDRSRSPTAEERHVAEKEQ